MEIVAGLVTGAAVLAIAACAGLFSLLRAHRRLRREFDALAEQMQRQNNDLTGLSSAGVHVDRLLLDHEIRLRQCLESLENLTPPSPPAPAPTAEAAPAPRLPSHRPAGHQPPASPPADPYQTAIDRIKQGASPEAVAAEFGITLSEAALLARLHGSNSARR
jgi:hypothetical protein